MEKSNLIISIIIVVCIAAGVAAYGITNSDNVIFSNLAGVGSDSGNNGLGSGNNSSGINVETGSGSSSGTGSGSGHGSGTGSGSGSGQGSGTGSGSGGSKPSPSQTKITPSKAKSIANQHISQEGCYAGTPQDTGSEYIVPVLNENGKQVGEISISYSGKVIGGGGGG